MSRPEFDISIGKDGKGTVRVTGASGEECLQLSDMLKEIIGREESREMTSEFYGPGGVVRIETHVRAQRPS